MTRTKTTPTQRTATPERTARVAAAFYTALAVLGGLAHFYIRGKVYKPGDAEATITAVGQHETLVRFGVLADLVGAAAYLFLALALYRLLRHLHRDLANVMVILVAIGAGITCLNLVFQVGGLITATDSTYLDRLGTGDAETLTLLMFDLQYYGYILLQVFTGLWLIPLALLALMSNGFPKPLCYALMFAGLCYLADLVIQVMAPELARDVTEAVLAPAAIAEMWMIGYLWLRGVGRNFISDEASYSAQTRA